MPFQLLAVCTGNICRSPQAEYILRSKLAAAGLSSLAAVSSCGTEGHSGWPADARSQRTAEAAGFSLAAHRARALDSEDLQHSGLLLALDSGHLQALRRLPGGAAKARLLMDFCGLDKPGQALQAGRSIVDPYYEDAAVFESVLGEIMASADGLVAALGWLQLRKEPQEQWTTLLMGDLAALRPAQ
jgi:protein-tyrosine phosphatase